MAGQSEPLLAVILSPKRVSAAELYLVGGAPHILALGDIPAPAKAFDEGQIASGEALGNAISEFMTEKRITAKKVVAVLPEGTAVTQLIKLPVMPREEMLGAVRSVAERYAVFAEHDISVDCSSVEELEEDGNRMASVLVAAARTANIEQCQECARAAGLDLVAMEALPVAAARAYREQLTASGVVALAVVGEVKTDVMIFDNGVLRLCYSANVGLPEEGAKGDWMTPQAGDRDPFTAPPQLYSELTHCFRFFQNQFPGKGVERAIISADHPKAELIASELSQQMQMPVELGRPPSDFHLPSHVEEAAAFGSRALTLALLRGCALAGLSEGEPFFPINLLPPSRAIWLPARGAIKVGVVLIAIALLASIVWATSLRNRIDVQEKKLSSTRAQIALLEPQLQALRAARATEQALRNEVERETARLAKERAVRWSQILVDIADRLPRDMWLIEMTAPDSSRVRLIGIATNRETIPDAIQLLSGSPYLNNVVLGSLNKDDTYAPGRTVIRYQINARLLRGLLPPTAELAVAPAPPAEEEEAATTSPTEGSEE